MHASRKAITALGSQLAIPRLEHEEAGQDAREDIAVAIDWLSGCFGRAHLRW